MNFGSFLLILSFFGGIVAAGFYFWKSNRQAKLSLGTGKSIYATRSCRMVLAVLAEAIIVTGWIIPHGELYGNASIGIPFFCMWLLGSAGMLLALIMPVIIILFLAANACALGAAMSLVAGIAVCRRNAKSVATAASWVFGYLAVSMFLGLWAVYAIQALQVGPHIEGYYFWWPTAFGVFSFIYAMIARKAG